MITKQFEASELKVNEGSREVVCCISTETPDRDREVVLAKGMQKKAFQGNPIVLVNHEAEYLPIGVARWVKSEPGRLIAKWYCSDKTQLARDVFGLLQDKCLNAYSIRFNPLEAGPPTDRERKEKGWQDVTTVFRKYELIEFSVVSIPANPEALSIAVAKGCSKDTLKMFGYKDTCWQWAEEKDMREEALIEKLKTSYCRPWTEIRKQLDSIMVADPDELMRRLQGRA